MSNGCHNAAAPMCLGLVFCDAIWIDPGTGKRTILGTFSTVFAREFPALHPQLAVYCILSDGYGKTAIEFKIVDDHDEEILASKGEVEFKDPRVVVELNLTLPGIIFPKPGEYRLQLFGAGEFLLERRLLVLGPQTPGANRDE